VPSFLGLAMTVGGGEFPRKGGKAERRKIGKREKVRFPIFRRLASATGAALHHPIDYGGFVFLVPPENRKELGGENVVLFEERAIPSATKHQRGWKFAAEFRAGFEQKARQPGNPPDGLGLSRERGVVEQGGGWPTALNIEKVIAADQFDGESVFKPRLAFVVVLIFGVIVHVLRRQAVGREPRFLFIVEKGVGSPLADA